MAIAIWLLVGALVRTASAGFVGAPATAHRAGSAGVAGAPATAHRADRRAPATLASVREYNADEEKALRKARIEFGGYPPGKYYELPPSEQYDAVRKDWPVLGEWADDDLKDTMSEIKPNFVEIMKDTPIGPFLVLSSISIAMNWERYSAMMFPQ